MALAFTKMQACGNDFIVVDDREHRLLGQESLLAQHVCHRRFGIGADGLLVIRPGRQNGHLGMVFVNANGLEGEMCGNGARCVAAYARRHHLVNTPTLRLDTLAGEVLVTFDPQGLIRLCLPPPGALHPGTDIEWGGRVWHFEAIDVGPPHVVCWLDSVDTLQSLDAVTLGRVVREHPAFAPRGCNVNFVALNAHGHLHMRTYERGVEDETLGCGTGACASALVGYAQRGMPPDITVITRSTEPLHVRLDHPDGIELAGGAHFVAQGHLIETPWMPQWVGPSA